MALDGITVAALCSELDDTLRDGRISKIIQPEADEILLTIKNNGENHRLLLSASASLPLAHLTTDNKPAPKTAPGFCMLLRKYIGGGRITSVRQPGMERILRLEIAHFNELGDPVTHTLILELMGKYSNLILTDENDVIVDAIKRIPAHVSSVREVLPGRNYFVPETQIKLDPADCSEALFRSAVSGKPLPLAKAIYTSFTGISPLCAEEICFRAGADGGRPASALDENGLSALSHTFSDMMRLVNAKSFRPAVYLRGNVPQAFYALPLTQYADCTCCETKSVSEMLSAFYDGREKATRIRQKSADLRKLVTTLLERSAKKLQLQEKQLHDTDKRENFRIWGELLNTYGYSLEDGADHLDAVNYYNNENVRIPLDPTKSASDNAKHYFARYTKLKRTAEDLGERIKVTQSEVSHLQSIRTSLDIAETETDLAEIRRELESEGYVRKKHTSGKPGKSPKKTPPSEPLHFVSSEGYDIYVGKNNIQNEYVSFSLAAADDWWFHAKKMPGSHVVVKCPLMEMPDSVYEEAGRLAAYYSSGRGAPKVEIDYTQKKNLRRPGGAKPGFVVYYTNYSLMAEPDITGIRQVQES